MLPSRINREDVRGKPKLRSPAHRNWVRSHHCCVPACQMMPIECAHVRTAATAGVGFKSSDAFTLSLCKAHHMQQHQIGQQSFEKMHGVDMTALAREFYQRSPHKAKLDNPYA